MTHLEKHVAAVRNKLFVSLFINALAWGAAALAGIGLLLVIIDRLFAVSLPAPWRWPAALIAVGVGLSAAFLTAYSRRPTHQAAAVAIDAKLGLKERFSTAISIAPSSDAFAMAAVQDAQEAARGIDLARQFPLQVGRQWRAAAVLLGLAMVGGFFLPRFDLFGHRAQLTARTNDDLAQQTVRVNVDRALAVVGSSPRFKNDELDSLVDELRGLAKLPAIKDPQAVNRKIQRAIELGEELAAKDVRLPKAGEDAPKSGLMEKGQPIAGKDGKWGQDPNAKVDRPDVLPRPGRPEVAGDRLTGTGAATGSGTKNGVDPATQPNPSNQPGQPNGRNNPAAGNDPRAGNNPGQGNAPGNAPGQANGPNKDPGIAGPGDRPKTAAPFAMKPEHSPSQDDPKGRILARDLVASHADVGKQRTTMAEAAKAAREQAADEVDVDHVSGPAQSAARKYFRTAENTKE